MRNRYETKTELLLDDKKDEVIFYHEGYISALECLLTFIDVEKATQEQIIKYSKLQIKAEKRYIKMRKKINESK